MIDLSVPSEKRRVAVMAWLRNEFGSEPLEVIQKRIEEESKRKEKKVAKLEAVKEAVKLYSKRERHIQNLMQTLGKSREEVEEWLNG